MEEYDTYGWDQATTLSFCYLFPQGDWCSRKVAEKGDCHVICVFFFEEVVADDAYCLVFQCVNREKLSLFKIQTNVWIIIDFSMLYCIFKKATDKKVQDHQD